MSGSSISRPQLQLLELKTRDVSFLEIEKIGGRLGAQVTQRRGCACEAVLHEKWLEGVHHRRANPAGALRWRLLPPPVSCQCRACPTTDAA